MKRLFYALLATCIIFASAGCQKASPGDAQGNEQPDEIIEEPVDEPMEPIEPEQGQDIPYPGLPVYVETEAYWEASRQAEKNPNGPPQEVSDGLRGYTVFDHFEDPPPEGTVRLVYDYNYGEIETLLIEDKAEVAAILNIADSFKISDYNSGPLLGGYMVQIQAVRDGVHQCYSALSGKHNGGYIAVNGRDSENWYEISEEDFILLMDYFGGIPR